MKVRIKRDETQFYRIDEAPPRPWDIYVDLPEDLVDRYVDAIAEFDAVKDILEKIVEDYEDSNHPGDNVAIQDEPPREDDKSDEKLTGHHVWENSENGFLLHLVGPDGITRTIQGQTRMECVQRAIWD